MSTGSSCRIALVTPLATQVARQPAANAADALAAHSDRYTALKMLRFEEKMYFLAYVPDNNIDICFVELPIKIRSWLNANVTFFPLKHGPFYSSIEKNLLVLAGFPSETMPKDKSAYGILYYFTDFVEKKVYSDWDEIMLLTDYEQNPNLIKSFKGVSGGAIWGFRLFNKDSFGNERIFFKNDETYIAGVCYYQTPTENKKGLIKAVGPYTIYNLLYNYVVTQKICPYNFC